MFGVNSKILYKSKWFDPNKYISMCWLSHSFQLIWNDDNVFDRKSMTHTLLITTIGIHNHFPFQTTKRFFRGGSSWNLTVSFYFAAIHTFHPFNKLIPFLPCAIFLLCRIMTIYINRNMLCVTGIVLFHQSFQMSTALIYIRTIYQTSKTW